ncbi:hypothetical protein H7F33_16605 [Pedobacter sp. PAMC26386]|nr:hypothetical protein H7F33_16605 [Pedobacter sp. PAMC26386]
MENFEKKTKLRVLTIAIIAGCFALLQTSCKKLEGLGGGGGGKSKKFEALIAYKKSPHQIMAGYYRTWGDSLVENNSGQRTMLQIPDSVDIVNVFADYTAPDHKYWTVLKDKYIPYLHERGTKVVVTSGIPSERVPAMTAEELKTWVGGFIAENNKYDYDGIDLDMESGGGTTATGLFGGYFRGNQQDLDRTYSKIEALSKYFGPKSGTGKLFILDLNYANLPAPFLKSIEGFLDYVFMQRYFGGQLDQLYTEGYAGSIPPSKYILGASFEDGSARKGSVPLFYQYARWNPKEGAKGGIFSYGLDADGTYSNPSYSFTKNAIQILNPAKKK